MYLDILKTKTIAIQCIKKPFYVDSSRLVYLHFLLTESVKWPAAGRERGTACHVTQFAYKSDKSIESFILVPDCR